MASSTALPSTALATPADTRSPRPAQHALLLTYAHDHLLRTGLAEITDPDPSAPSQLRTAARAYQAALHDLARRIKLERT
jgi:hypothetical protein